MSLSHPRWTEQTLILAGWLVVGSFALFGSVLYQGTQAQPPDAVRVAEQPAQPLVAAAEAPSHETVWATAYCDLGITKSGVAVTKGIVAADPRLFPLGTVMEVRAGRYSGIYTVMDTGGAVKGRIIDIFIPDYDEAVQFGRRKVSVRVLRHGWSPKRSPGTATAG